MAFIYQLKQTFTFYQVLIPCLDYRIHLPKNKFLLLPFHLDNTSATKGCKNAGQILNTIETDSNRTHYCETKPENFIERFCSKLNINKELTKVCMFVAHKIEQNNYINFKKIYQCLDCGNFSHNKCLKQINKDHCIFCYKDNNPNLPF